MEIVRREPELAAIEEFLAAPRSQPVAVVLNGSAGIGKTALWAAAAARTRGSGAPLVARVAESEATVAYSGLADLFGEPLPPGVSRRDRHVLAVAFRRSAGAVDELAIRRAAVAALDGYAAAGRSVIAIDDLQWLDSASAAALGYALRRTRFAFAVLATVRQGEQPPQLELSSVLGSEHVLEQRIGPLDDGAVAQLLAAHGRTASARVLAEARGNALFALELARAEDGDVPDSLRRLIDRRIGGLTPRVRRLLRLVGASGHPSLSVVEAAGLGDAVDEAVDLELVTVSDGRIVPAHPLYASTAYAAAPADTRRRLHAALARAVTDPEERALHLARATVRPQEKVATELEEASKIAVRRGAPRAAAELLEQAARLTPESDADARLRRLLASADLYGLVGEMSKARAMIEHALAGMPWGDARARALLALGGNSWDDARTVTAVCNEALDQTADDTLRAELLTLRASSLFVTGDLRGCDDSARRAIAHAEAAGDARLLVAALGQAAYSSIALQRPDARAMLGRATSLGVEPDAPPGLAGQSPKAILAHLLVWSGEFDEARALFREQLGLAQTWGDEIAASNMLTMLTYLECRAGNLAEAERHATVNDELAPRLGHRLGYAYSLWARALVEAYAGRLDRARERAEAALALAHGDGFHLLRIGCLDTLALVALSAGDAAEVVRLLEPVPAEMDELGWFEPGVHPTREKLAEAYVLCDSLHAAQVAIDQLENRARTGRRIGALAGAARCRGLVATAERRYEEAIAYFDAALVVGSEVPEPFEIARTQLQRGVALRRARRRAEAKETLDRAHQMFTEIGAAVWAERASDETLRIGLRRAADELTATERRVAACAAAGQTNREIAAALYMSVKSVESNLSRVYRKLGVRSRTELARHSLERQSAGFS